MYKFSLLLFGLICLLPSYANAQLDDDQTVTNKKEVAMVYIMFDASLTRFHTPLDETTKNFNSPLGITIGAGTAFDTFLNGVFEVSTYEIEEPLSSYIDLSSETQIWNFMGGLKLQDPNQHIFWDLLAGLNTHIYNFSGVDLGELGTTHSFAMSTSLNIPVLRLKNTPVIASFSARKVFHEDIGNINYSFGLKIMQIFTR